MSSWRAYVGCGDKRHGFMPCSTIPLLPSFSFSLPSFSLSFPILPYSFSLSFFSLLHSLLSSFLSLLLRLKGTLEYYLQRLSHAQLNSKSWLQSSQRESFWTLGWGFQQLAGRHFPPQSFLHHGVNRQGWWVWTLYQIKVKLQYRNKWKPLYQWLGDRNGSLQIEWKWKLLSRVRLFATPWTIQSMKFSRLEYWSG